jgi:hypothetical protein
MARLSVNIQSIQSPGEARISIHENNFVSFSSFRDKWQEFIGLYVNARAFVFMAVFRHIECVREEEDLARCVSLSRW